MKKSFFLRCALTALFAFLLMPACEAYAAVYPTVLPLPVPRVAQVSTGVGNDCYVCSVASLQAYHAGSSAYSYTTVNAVQSVAAGTKLTRTYTGAGDYNWLNDPFWHLIADKNYPINAKEFPDSKHNFRLVYMWLGSYRTTLPQPMALSTGRYLSSDETNKASQETLQEIYGKISTGRPVVIHYNLDDKIMHASVIIGYHGKDQTTLRLCDFTVMEINAYKKNSAAIFNEYATKPATSDSENHCYYTLEAWLKKTFEVTTASVNLSWSSNTVTGVAYTEGPAETMTFRVIAHGSDRLSANTYPYGAAPASRMLTVGETVTTVGTVTNSFGNVWYKLANGTFVWAGILAEPSAAGNASVSGIPLTGQFFEGKVPKITGTVSSTDCITSISAEIYNGNSAETGEVLTAEYKASNMQTTSVSLASTPIGKLDLSALKDGYWYLTLTVNFGNSNPQTKYFEYEFEVVKNEISQIIVPSSLEIMCGNSVTPQISVLPEGCEMTGLTYTVDHPSAALVTSAGVVTGLYDPYISETTLRITAKNGVTASVPVRITTNITGESFRLNGQSISRIEVADLFSLGQTVPFEYSCTLANDYNPGYTVSIRSESGAAVSADSAARTISFHEAGLARLTVDFPGPSASLSAAVIVTDDTLTARLPNSLTHIESSAFRGAKMRFFFLPAGVSYISPDAFPDGSFVFLDTTALESTPVFTNSICLVETGSAYNEAVAAAHNPYYALRGVTLPAVWSDWSDWSETPVAADESTQVETRLQYRSAPITTVQQLTAWSAWGSWSATKKTISNSTLMEQQTRTAYPYYYFQCSSCSAHMPYYGRGCLTNLGGCGKSNTVVQSSWHEGIWLPTTKAQCTSYNNGAKYYTTVNGAKYYYWSDSPTASRTEYRYRTRSYKDVQQTGAFGAWTTEAITPSDTLAVETRTVYRFRTLIP